MTRVLVDTSVWIAHFRAADSHLMELLQLDNVVIHLAVIGELAVGTIPRRQATLGCLRQLPLATAVPYEELLELVENKRLFQQGLSWIDVQLLASALVDGLELWTLDRALAASWKRLMLRQA